MSLINTAISGLNVAQTALEVTGNNISNAETEGYSRQVVEVSSSISLYTGSGYIGTGADVVDITRITDEFLTVQLRSDTSDFFDLETYRELIEQVDTLISTDSTGLQSSMDQFFAALQTAAENPAYIPSREVLIGEAESLSAQFNMVADYLNDIETTLDSQIAASAKEVNSLAETIALLNQQIMSSAGSATGLDANDLLDARDQAVLELSSYIDVDVDEVDGGYNISIGSGQALVLGVTSYSIEATASESDPTQMGITYVGATSRVDITDDISGGSIAGMIDFREQSLDSTYNSIGQLALTISEAINSTHTYGLDLNGEWGGEFFSEINSDDLVSNRVTSFYTNTSANDNYFSVYIEDTSALTGSDYTLSVPGPGTTRYQITDGDGNVVLEGGLQNDFPQEIEFDGLRLVIEDGSFAEGDGFTINPYSGAAENMTTVISDPEAVALAYPIRAITNLSNNGSGEIDQGTMLSIDTETFSVDGELSPPLVIVFHDEYTYSVYDNTDEGNPVSLEPPLEYLSYVPGTTNTIFTDDPGETQVSSWRARLPFDATTVDQGDTEDLYNGINPERFEFYYTDSETGEVTLMDDLSTESGASAAEIANELSFIDGVEARAYTEVQMTNFTNNGTTYVPDNEFEVWINGFNITSEVTASSQTTYMDGYPEEVPDEMTPDFLADRINSHYELVDSGIVAYSDGTTLTIVDSSGEDIVIEMTGDKPDEVLVDGVPDVIDPGDSFQLSTGQTWSIDPIVGNTDGSLNNNTGYDFTEEGPYEYELYLPDGRTGYITLDQNYSDAETMIADIEDKITDLLDDTSVAEVSIDASGNLSYKTLMTISGTGDPTQVEAVSIGGQVDITMADGISLETDPDIGGIFNGIPDAQSTYFGFQFEISGNPEAGDEFSIEWNEDGVSDNRNALDLVNLETAEIVYGTTTMGELYSLTVERVGAQTSSVQVLASASEVILETTAAEVQSIQGVNLDEEAALLIEYQALYSANAKVISVAQELFDTLLATF
ncbi:flagellar hook-associated protein FlgK [Reinekea thalattae]|uniref:Flagellar hook-associated protein 1 n=1 Tax=Reinekea thalattae TaxID=2593301 RepID=A0A5C8Z5K0_9GAMM|nr:flagellar hook-associated protein FlgK [Reinekea thalattae]TXR53242.1 flagellar hook-associated protein FlgK [Reinekea thalattae]